MTDYSSDTSLEANVITRYTVREEIAHSLSHGLGFVMALIAAILLVIQATRTQAEFALFAVVIYALSLVFLFAASTLYHASFGRPVQQFYKLLDHCAIYIKIAGSYTPFTLLVLPSPRGIWLLAFVWLLATIGIFFKSYAYQRRSGNNYKALSLFVYLAMGWSAIFLLEDLLVGLSGGGIYWLVAGGLAYSLGALFYAIKSMPFGHFIWHIFVLFGSACHVVTVYFYVL